MNREPIPWSTRDMLPTLDEVQVLARLAAQPRNCKTRKPALFMLLYAAGEPKEKILAELNVGAASLERWYTRWVEDGLDGCSSWAIAAWNVSWLRWSRN